MRIVLITIIAFCSYCCVYAQQYGVYGSICNTDGNPIEFANITILNSNDSTFVSGAISGEQGEFNVKLAKGNYILELSSLGYVPKNYDIKLLNDVDLGVCTLCSDVISLDEIVVSGMRPTIKRTAIGLTVSIDGVKHLQNKTLYRILNVSPGVFVGKKGDISINGNGGVTVIVNDKIMRISGEQLISYLKSMQGSDLKNIEIISNPTSEYSAEGTGGIIRINTKRKSEMGLSGYASVNYAYDRRSSYQPSLGLAYSFKRFTLYGNYSYSDDRNISNYFSESNYKHYTRQNIVKGDFRTRSKNHNYRLGMDWNISDNHFVGIEYNGQTVHKNCSGNSFSQVVIDGAQTQTINTGSLQSERPNNNLLNLNYTWQIDTVGQALKFIADYSNVIGMRSNGIYLNEYFDENGIVINNLNKNQLSNESSQIYSMQLDYKKPIKRKLFYLDCGLKYSHVAIDYNYNLLTWDNYNQPQSDSRFKDDFRFTESLASAYLNFSYNSKKMDVNVGLRAEYTNRAGVSYVTEQRNANSNFRIFPSCFFYYKPGGSSAFMLYYGMRIQRPSYELLNPFVAYNTDLSYKIGNPQLKPMLSNVVEFTYVLSNRYYISLRANMTNDKIRDYSFIDDDVVVTTFANISQSNMYYLNAYIPFVVRKWTSSILFNVGLLDTNIEDLNRKALSMDISWDNYVQLTEKLGLQGNFIYSPPYKDVYQTFKRHVVKLNFSLDYSCLKDKCLLSVGMDDVLNSMRKRTVIFNYPDLAEHATTRGVFSGRTIWLAFKYNFSTLKRAKERRKEKSNIDEINRL